MKLSQQHDTLVLLPLTSCMSGRSGGSTGRGSFSQVVGPGVHKGEFEGNTVELRHEEKGFSHQRCNRDLFL